MFVKCMALFGFLIVLHIAAGDESTRAKCRLPADSGDCYAFMPRWYSPGSGDCEEFIYGGCNGNDNNFSSYKECMAVCREI